MPTYDYECSACGHTFEEFQSMSAKPLKKCPACGKNKLVRLIGTGAGVIFKGSGFYETDYRSDSYKKSEKAEKDSAKPKKDDAKSESASKSESKTPAKSEAKSDAKPSGDSDKK